MLSNHLFWLAIALLTWSGFNINTAVNFKGSSVITQNIIQWIGIIGIIAGLIRAVSLSIHFNWWWLVGIVVGFFVAIGILSALFKGLTAVIISVTGIVGIPSVWWMGGMF